MDKQNTLKGKVCFEGVGLHSGLAAKVEVLPLPADSGIIFERKDITSAPFKASVNAVLKSEKFLRRTCIGTDTVYIQTVEHLMAALYLAGIDNAKVDVWGEEIPGMDGSAKEFFDEFHKAGILEQDAPRKYICIKEPLFIEAGSRTITALPADELRISYTLQYDNPVIGTSCFTSAIGRGRGKAALEKIYEARTFCLEEEAKKLLEMGMGKGSNYANTLVVSQTEVVKNKLRCLDEFAKHKVLDLIGDLYLAGSVKANMIAVKSGHTATIQLLEKIMKTQSSIGEGGTLMIEDIMNILPHRFPFLLVDRITHLEKGKKATGIKSVTMNEHFFQGHFPSRPVMPGVLIIEAMAQVAGVAMLSCDEHKGKLAFFMAINNAKFRKPVVPGDQLRFEIEVVKARSKTGIVEAKAFVADDLVAEGELMFAFVD
jgi:UDP-3-O-[3-hydroxymyristoyl] N-acetylglucosamine deacetylase/3-hydroxyacyl-[acyl-carrier-protein] dehydratase